MVRRTGPLLSIAVAVVAWLASTLVVAQQPPRPFPQPGQPRTTAPASPPPSAPRPTAPQPAAPQPASPARQAAPLASEAAVPTEASLGVPLYPTAQFITSYDAGRGQRFYLFGVALPFAEVVSYYRTALKTRGDVLFETPPTHQFEIGRFREETMAFPPSVTVKDYTFGGSAGFLNPKPGARPDRFPTIVQIVAAPAGTP